MKAERIPRTALFSLGLNLAFALYTGAVGIANRSWWFLTLAAYYGILGGMRAAILLVHRRCPDGSSVGQRLMRRTGVVFLLLSVVLAGTTYLSFSDNRGVRQHEIVMITIALYAFVKITLAIIHLVNLRSSVSPFVRTLRNISFADALVSIFSLQRSMLVSFGDLDAAVISLFNALTGSGVYLMVFLLGINLIGGKRVTMAKSKFIQANEKIAEAVTDGYKKIETGVVEGYKKIETGVVEGYTKMEDQFIDRFLTREGESVEEARERLKKNDD